MTKKIVSVLLLVCLLLGGQVVLAANEDISVYVDGRILYFDVQPQIIDGRTMVPMRKIFEALGASVAWDGVTQTVTGRKGDTVVNVTIGSKVLFKNGMPTTLDVAPALIDSRTLVPARAIAESFACTVTWVEETRTVQIATNGTGTGTGELSASQISTFVAPSVFYIEVYDDKGKATASGSGFFISENGVAVTNYHVIEDTAAACVTTIDGEEYPVESVIAFDEALDVAVIRVSKTAKSGKTVSAFPKAVLTDSDAAYAGQTVYAIGSPMGLQNTISNGIISNPKQVVGEDTFIQITAPISHGSSGGALVNAYGEVLGITSAGLDEAQNIGFAIPINVVKAFDIHAVGIPYTQFKEESLAFTLLLGKETVEITAGDTAEVLVYAEGKGDWSIYWDTKQENIVDCEWGDWLESNSSICTLYIKGLREGTATVTVYSDVDFKGKDITVYVKKPQIATYPSSTVAVPTYTSITGVQPTDYEIYDASRMYSYPYYDISVVQSYVDYLQRNGFTFYKKEPDQDSTAYYYRTPENSLLGVVVAHRWKEVWIYVPR